MSKNIPVYNYLPLDRAVMFKCSEHGLSFIEIDTWLRRVTSLNFVHVVKGRYNRYLKQFYYFYYNQLEAKPFYDEMKGRVFEGPKGVSIEFIKDDTEKDENKVPYRIYEKDDIFETLLLTPRITNKSNYKMQGLNEHLIIKGTFSEKSTRKDCVIDLFPTGKFKIHIKLPSRIDHNATINIITQNGLTKIEIKKLGNQLRSLVLNND